MSEVIEVRSVLAHFPALVERHDPQTVAIDPISDGLINATWRVGEFILQRLHPIFGAAVNQDIAALTPVLSAAGVPVPTLFEADDGAWSVCRNNDVWRLLSALPGRTIHRVERPEQVRNAAGVLARFHAALADSDHVFQSVRPGAHDTDAHMNKAALTVAEHPRHRLASAVAPMVEELTQRWRDCPRAPAGQPVRVIHGDLKISNFLFGDDDAVVGLIDLDTMARSTLEIELGDALRSWCNLNGEDAATVAFSVPVFTAAVSGYLSTAGAFVSPSEARSWVPGLERIALELSARFAADALNESYFGWSPDVAPTRGDHNLIRAANQLQLARAVAGHRDALQAIVEAARGSAV